MSPNSSLRFVTDNCTTLLSAGDVSEPWVGFYLPLTCASFTSRIMKPRVHVLFAAVAWQLQQPLEIKILKTRVSEYSRGAEQSGWITPLRFTTNQREQ